MGLLLPARVKVVMVVVLPGLFSVPLGLLTLEPLSHLSE